MRNVAKFVSVLALSLFAFVAINSRANADDIVGVASKNSMFKTLVAAVKAADLVETLQGEGPFTVFAPTDQAFQKLPKGTLEMLLKPENKDKLKAILTYHVISGKVPASEVMKLKSGSMVETVQGEKVKVLLSKKGVMVNKSKVVKTDVMASNGVIHVIDTVLLPPSTQKAKKHSK